MANPPLQPLQPLGIIVAYMGELESKSPLIDDDGSTWLLCDGSEVSADTYGDLYSVIGDIFGDAPDDGYFSLPNLTGYFIRVLDEDSAGNTSGRDPNYKAERIPALQQENPSFIGSTQRDAAPHEHAINGFALADESDHSRNMMSNDNPAQFDEWTDPAGFAETKPLNAAVNFIIRAAADNSATPPAGPGLPVGSIIYYSAPGAPVPPRPSTETWIACDGIVATANRFNPDNITETELFAAIGTNFGEGDGKSTFGIPDLRGFFLRGVTNDKTRDPDWALRIPINSGHKPNDVASRQSPAVTDHTHSFPNTYGTDLDPDGDDYVKPSSPDSGYPGPFASYQTYNYTDTTRGQTTTIGSDIRPINVALTSAILQSNSSAHLPIGSIVAYGGSGDPKPATPGQVWEICDGRTVSNASQEYQQLFSALFATPSVQLPDLRGFFLRALDSDGAIDLDVRTPMFNAAPTAPSPAPLSLETDSFGLHYHAITSGHFMYHSSDTEVASADNDGGDPSCATDGVLNVASSETRPINIYVNFIIRIA